MNDRHELKTDTAMYQAVVRGYKPYEFRKDDRGFKLGDTLVLREWLPKDLAYTGFFCEVEVTHILRGGKYGIPSGYCVMGTRRAGRENARTPDRP